MHKKHRIIQRLYNCRTSPSRNPKERGMLTRNKASSNYPKVLVALIYKERQYLFSSSSSSSSILTLSFAQRLPTIAGGRARDGNGDGWRGRLLFIIKSLQEEQEYFSEKMLHVCSRFFNFCSKRYSRHTKEHAIRSEDDDRIVIIIRVRAAVAL